MRAQSRRETPLLTSLCSLGKTFLKAPWPLVPPSSPRCTELPGWGLSGNVVHASPGVERTPLDGVVLWRLFCSLSLLSPHRRWLEDSAPACRCTITRTTLGSWRRQGGGATPQGGILASTCFLSFVLFVSCLRTWEGKRNLLR